MMKKVWCEIAGAATIIALSAQTQAQAPAQQGNTLSTVDRTKNMSDYNLQKLLPSSIPLWNKNLGPDTVVLDVTRSTNTPAYRIMIKRNGDASYEDSGGGEKHAKVPEDLAAKIFKTLEKSWPLPATGEHVMKSASFGCYSYITYDGLHSGDLDALAHSAGVQALRADFQELRKCF